MEPVLVSRVKALCSDHKITITRFEEEAGLAAGSIRRWTTVSSPVTDKLRSVSEYFNVSTDYLLGYSDVQTRAEETMGDPAVQDVLSDSDVCDLIQAIHKMTPHDRDKLIHIARIAFDYAFDK